MAEVEAQTRSIQSIYGWYSDRKLDVNRRYQRKLVWTLLEKQKLIQSVRQRFPIPAILLAENSDGGYEIIDGVQRLFAIMSFVENKFEAEDGAHFDVNHFTTAKTRADADVFTAVTEGKLLSQREVGAFLDYDISISIMRDADEAEIDEVFSRINTYGHRLSDQERRQAGVQDDFSRMVRDIACTLRNDASSDVLDLSEMPSISIDLPMNKHGYEVLAEDVFWVQQGILRSTDLRDSLDEQYVADMAACVVGGQLIERSKDALDAIYVDQSPENIRINDALDAYGPGTFADELKYCIDELLKVCADGTPKRLRDIVFERPSTNGFPSVFAVLILALHELLVVQKNVITDYSGAKNSLENIYGTIETRKATKPEQRRRNVEIAKGLLQKHVTAGTPPRPIYGSHSTADIDSLIRRSEIETANYELKQGAVNLAPARALDPNVFDRVIETICAIANIGKNSSGTIVIGVTDKDADAQRVEKLDSLKPRPVGKRFVVGVRREANFLGDSMEQYVARWKNAIRASGLTTELKDSVLANIDVHDYFGYGVILIRVPPQRQLSFLGQKTFERQADETLEVTDMPKIAALALRFS